MKSVIKKRLKKFQSNHDITIEDIEKSKTILFSVFSRYGDGIISFQIIKEFIKKYSDKEYIILVPRQQMPYAKVILDGLPNVIIKKVNKRNIVEFFLTINFLKKSNIDLAFNPWGHGDDSEFYITFAKKFQFYKLFDNFSKEFNLYDRIRVYLNLEIQALKSSKSFDLDSKKKILIAPFSTDITKNISEDNINSLIHYFHTKNSDGDIVVALPKEKQNLNINAAKFIFGKSIKNSQEYLQKLRDSDLFIGVDSGPLHIALALEIDTIGIFGPTAPETILNNRQKILILRDKSLNGIFCFKKDCEFPLCIDTLFKDIQFSSYQFSESVSLETDICSFKD